MLNFSSLIHVFFQVLNRSMDPKTYLAPLIAQLPPPVQFNLLPQVCAYHQFIQSIPFCSRMNERANDAVWRLHVHFLSYENVVLRET